MLKCFFFILPIDRHFIKNIVYHQMSQRFRISSRATTKRIGMGWSSQWFELTFILCTFILWLVCQTPTHTIKLHKNYVAELGLEQGTPGLAVSKLLIAQWSSVTSAWWDSFPPFTSANLLLLIQDGQLSVADVSMCTKCWITTLED